MKSENQIFNPSENSEKKTWEKPLLLIDSIYTTESNILGLLLDHNGFPTHHPTPLSS